MTVPFEDFTGGSIKWDAEEHRADHSRKSRPASPDDRLVSAYPLLVDVLAGLGYSALEKPKIIHPPLAFAPPPTKDDSSGDLQISPPRTLEQDDADWLTPQELGEQAKQRLYALVPLPDQQHASCSEEPKRNGTVATASRPNHGPTPLIGRAGQMISYCILTFLILSALTTPTSHIEATKLIHPLPFASPSISSKSDRVPLKLTEPAKSMAIDVRRLAVPVPTTPWSHYFGNSSAGGRVSNGAASVVPRRSKQPRQ